MKDKAKKVSPKLSLALRLLLVLVLSGVISLYLRSLPVEQDVVKSIERSRPEEAALFQSLQSSGLFQDRLWIRFTDPDPSLRREALAKLAQYAYFPVDIQARPALEVEALYGLLPFLPSDRLEELLSSVQVEKILRQAEGALSLPGGMGLLKQLQKDPLLLSQELSRLFSPDEKPADVILAAREGPLDFEAVRGLYAYLQSQDQRLLFLGGDFFALENRDTVQKDILLCSFLSLALGLLIFRFFCRQWSVLLLLVVGTCFSSLLGLLLLRFSDGMVYGLVLAFVSTFVSFNNEALVHLAGHRLRTSPRALVGMASAIGTTILGFLVLLASSLDMARQMGLIALGSLCGFLLFLLLFRREVQNFRFRLLELSLPSWNKGPAIAIFLGLLALMFLLPKPAYRTDLMAFRYTSSYLEHMVQRFSDSFARLDLQNIQAQQVTGDIKLAFDQWDRSELLKKEAFHPLRSFIAPAEQAIRLPALQAQVDETLLALEKGLKDLGLRLPLPPLKLSQEGLDAKAYLTLWNQLSPLPFMLDQGHATYLIVFGRELPFVRGALPLHPKLFYESLLQNLSAQIGQLFLWGILAMLLYLLPWQQKVHKICLIFIPLLAAGLVLQILFLLTGRTINIVHVMGASLVIAVALDYSAILISHGHAAEEQGKVLLTGGLTLSSFASLLCATHPVLRELGLLVCVGSGSALIFALLCREKTVGLP